MQVQSRCKGSEVHMWCKCKAADAEQVQRRRGCSNAVVEVQMLWRCRVLAKMIVHVPRCPGGSEEKALRCAEFQLKRLWWRW